MGLAEKRAVEDFKKNEYEVFLKSIKDITQADISVDTEWDKLSPNLEGYGDAKATLVDYFQNMFAETILQSFKSICADDMGKQALQGAVKKIVLTCSPNASTHKAGFKFEDAILSLDLRYANTDQVKDRVESMIKLIESKL